MPHDVRAGMGKRFRSEFCIAQRRIVEDAGADCQQISMVLRAPLANREKLASIRVPDQWRESIGSQVSADVKQHRVKFVPVLLVDRNRVGAAQQKRVKEKLGDVAVIAG